MADYEALQAAAIDAANGLSLTATQRDRYEAAKLIADESGCAAVSVLPIINGRHRARRGLPPVTNVHFEPDEPYAYGYLWQGKEAK